MTQTLLARALALPLQTIAIGADKQIEYIDSGVGKHANTHTIVLLHGIGSGAASWVLQFEALAAQAANANIRLLAWNAPGYGNSTALVPDKPIAADYGRALWAWLDALGLDRSNATHRVHLVGHSLGCLMAAAAAALQPARVVALTLLSPAQGYGNATVELRDKVTNGRLENLAKLGAAGVAKARGAALLREDATEQEKELAIDTMSRIHVGGYTQAVQMLAWADIRSHVRAFQNVNVGSSAGASNTTIRVACGDVDTITPPKGARQLAADLDVPYTEIANAGHLVAIENAGAVNELLAFTPLSPTSLPQGERGFITVGDLCAEFLAAIGVRAAFGVISIHNMPILDGFHTRQKIRFVSARGEAGACNMADSYARVNQHLGVVVTSTGTGAGNAAGALVEAMTAGTSMLHLTGQIESTYLDKNLGFIHEAADQLGMLRSVGKAAYRISKPEEALAVLKQAVTLAFTPPCGPVSIEMAIDVQKMLLAQPAYPKDLQALLPTAQSPSGLQVDALAEVFLNSKRPLLWLGGGARQAGAAVDRLVKLGFGIVTSVQGRGIVREDHPQSMGAFNLQKAAQDLYAASDAMLVVGSRLRSNETLTYKLQLPNNLYRVDANPLACDQHPYVAEQFVCADALLTLTALADRLEGKTSIEGSWTAQIQTARAAAEVQVDSGLAAYVTLKNEVKNLIAAQTQAAPDSPPAWVRDITLSNTMWGNRSVNLSKPWQGVHALGGGIGQGLQMAIGASLMGTKAIALVGDGGLMLNVGELACAVQERASLLVIVMNDQRYGVIKNIQDADYGSRHAYVELHTPNFAKLCDSMGVMHHLLDAPAQTKVTLDAAWQQVEAGHVVMMEVDMQAWGEFAVKFAGPPRKV
jgi:acetolactate synthase I/II/III large subunit